MTTVKVWNPMILYEAQTGGNILLKSNLVKIYEIEKKMKESEYWKNVCLATSVVDQSCAAASFSSPLMFLDIAFSFGAIPSFGNVGDLTQD